MNSHTLNSSHSFMTNSMLETLPARQLKFIAKSAVWKLVILPNKHAKELNKAFSRSEGEWFNTSGAAFYCHCKTGDADIDWHSRLMENRRDQNDMCSVLCFGSPPRGNAERLGELRCFRYKRKVYYTAHDLDVWLSGFKT